MTTARDVARLAGVSTATVSYVFNGRSNRGQPVGPETRRRVLEAARTLDYVPNQAARSLRRRRTLRIGLVTSGIGVPWMDQLAAELQGAAEERGYALVLVPADSRERAGQAVRLLRQKLVDAAVIAPLNVPLDVPELRALARTGFPLVVCVNGVEPDGFDVLHTTEREACLEAVRALVAGGRRRIAYLADGPAQTPDPASERYQAYAQALEEAGLTPPAGLLLPGRDRAEAHASTLQLLARDEPPDAVFSATDRGAVAAMWAIGSTGRRIPRDVAVIGVGNIPESAITYPALSTVGPTEIDVTRISELLFRRLEGEVAPPVALIETWHYVRRGTS